MHFQYFVYLLMFRFLILPAISAFIVHFSYTIYQILTAYFKFNIIRTTEYYDKLHTNKLQYLWYFL
jgi:hypothetical protein